MASLNDPITWLGVAMWLGMAYFPIFILFVYVFATQKNLDGLQKESNGGEWFRGTKRGIWRLSGTFFFFWFLLIGCKGIAQFFAWDVDSETRSEWMYPAAMILFIISTFWDCLWVGTFFSMHQRFCTSTVLLAFEFFLLSFMIPLYFSLSIIAGILLVIYFIVIIIPMLLIAGVSCSAHSESDERFCYDNCILNSKYVDEEDPEFTNCNEKIENPEFLDLDSPERAERTDLPRRHVTGREDSPEPKPKKREIKIMKKTQTKTQTQPSKNVPHTSKDSAVRSAPDRKAQLEFLKIPISK